MIYVNSRRPLSCCDYAVQRESDTYQLAVVRAVRLLGGTGELAQRLQVPQSEVERWVAGAGRPSMGTFLKVMDLLLEEGGKPR